MDSQVNTIEAVLLLTAVMVVSMGATALTILTEELISPRAFGQNLTELNATNIENMTDVNQTGRISSRCQVC